MHPISAVTVRTTALVPATHGKRYSTHLVSNTSAVEWTAYGLPSGLTVSATTGVISGVPTVPGSYRVIVTAAHGTAEGAAALTLSVR
jgi:hypothetical protein